MTTDKVTIVFNYRSPFCALIADRTFALSEKFDVEFEWKIVPEVPRPSSLPITKDNPRLAYNRQDCARRAKWLGLNWNPPSDWRLEDVWAASRTGLWLLQRGHDAFEPFTLACSRAYWSDQRNVSDPAVVREIASETGLSSSELDEIDLAGAALDSDLTDNMRWAEREKVLGVPYFIFGGETFWGSDRFDDLTLRLTESGLKRVGPPPLSAMLPSPDRPLVPVKGGADLSVGRIFCVGRNYAEHAREMGSDERDPPFFFLKYPEGLVVDGTGIAYPPMTRNYHYEMELVVAIGKEAYDVDPSQATDVILGYAAGLDMTRRDLQLAAREKRRPWDTGKSFDESAVVGEIVQTREIAHPLSGRIRLSVNGETKQDSDIAELIWSVPEIIANLSKFYVLRRGDLIFTGTPAGVGPVVPGDSIRGEIEGIGTVSTTIHRASHEVAGE